MGSLAWVVVTLAALGLWHAPTAIGLFRRWHVGVCAMKKVRLLMPANSEEENIVARWVVEDWLRCAQAHLVVSYLEKYSGLRADVIGKLLFRCSAEAMTSRPVAFGETLGLRLMKLINDAESFLDASSINAMWARSKKEGETLAMMLKAMDEGRTLAA